MKPLSRSVKIMFLFDLIILYLSTFLWAVFFGYTSKAIITLCFLIVVTGIIVLYLKGNYKIREFNINIKNTYLLFEGIVMAHVLPSLYLLLFSASKTNSAYYLTANIFTIFIILRLYRAFYHLYLFRIKKVKNILVLGTDERARIIADEIQGKRALRMKVVGFVQENENDESFVFDKDVPVFKSSGNISNIIKDYDVDIIIISRPTELILDIPYGFSVYKMPDFYELVTGKYFIDDRTITEFYYNFIKNRSILYDFCKRIYDIIAALIILTVTLPITGYIAVRVKLIDGASPFFSQTRVGQNGKTFDCYKLRTMYVNDYVPQNAEMLNDGADRTIPFCKWIRKAKLDEIPQMLNILKGEMSIVGPRAEWEKFANVFDKDVPFYRMRNLIRAGWTGWAHINMKAAYSTDEEKERLAYDLYYIKHRNLFWDIAILVKAVFLACGGRHK